MTTKATKTQRRVASSETAREINRDILLQTIHRNQPVSRADLARMTGLQASTVSVIIGHLIEEGWVLPGVLGRLPRGRRPTFVRLNDRHAILAIDLRPAHANIAVVDINGKILSRKTVDFPPLKGNKGEARKILAKVAREARMLRGAHRDRIFDGVGVSISGRVDQRTQKLQFYANGPWAQMDVQKELRAFLQSPIEMDNAANASLFAERWFGQLGDATNVLAVSVSEGIGTGLLVDGQLLRGRDGMAGEFGHMPFDESGPMCGCGNKGCWETFASNRAGLRYYRELVPGAKVTTYQELLDLAGAGDLTAIRAIDRMIFKLAEGLTMLNAGLAPEVILIVGDCTALWPRISPILESKLIEKSFTARTPRVVAAIEGDTARLRGAAALVLHKVLFHRAELK